ncbi:MAG: DNRLRE domain-containing protein [Candidatus Eisenbacteria bacterium]
MRRDILHAFGLFLLLCGNAEGAATKIDTLQPGPSAGADTWISSQFPFLASGASDTLLIGQGDPALIPVIIDDPLKTAVVHSWRALLRFGVSSLPPDADVSEARLGLYVRNFFPISGGDMKIGAHPLTASWAEGTNGPVAGATWYHRNPPDTWAAAGGDFAAQVNDKDLKNPHVWIVWDIKNAVRPWVTNPGSNFGVLMKRKDGGYALGAFVSSDDPDSTHRPRLHIKYSSDIVDDLPALLGGAAEVQPTLVPKNTTVELTLYAELDVNDAYLGMGPDYLHIPVPAGFRLESVLGATFNGVPVSYKNSSDGDEVKLEFFKALASDGTLEVRLLVQTPIAPDPIGKAFIPAVDDKDTDHPSQTVSQGNANGIPGDGDTYVVRVAGGALASIIVTPANPVLTTDSTLLFTAAGYDIQGYPVIISPVWSVEGGIGTIEANGLFDPTTVGNGFVRATVGAISGLARATVAHGRAAAIAVSPADTTVILGKTVPYSAWAHDADGNGFAPAAAWWATPGIGSIGPDGVFVSEGLGSGIVVGSADGARDTAAVAVTFGPPVRIEVDPSAANVTADTLLPFAARVFDEMGNETGAPVQWSVAGGIGTIGAAGIFDARRVGAGFVVASLQTLADSAFVTVSHGEAVRVLIAPRDSTITAIDSLLFAATLFDSDTNAFTSPSVSWSEPTGTGTMDPAGLFHAFAAGTARIAAAEKALADTTSLFVLPGPAAALEVIPFTDTVGAEETIDFSAVATDARGNPVPDPGPIVWSGGSSIGSIHPSTGLFTPGSVGTDSVAAAAGPIVGRSGPIVVVAGPTRSVVVEPASLEILAGEDTLFTAAAYDIAGNPTGEAVSWSALGGIGSISAGGIFTASASGSGSVVGAASSVADTAAVSVFDNTGIRIDAIIENRSTVTRGEAGIEVRLAFTNETGDSLVNLAGTLRFSIGGGDVSGQYQATPIPFTNEPLADGSSDTLRFLVAVGESATIGSPVVIDGQIAAVLQTSGGPAAGLSAIQKGSWTVGDAPVLVDVSRSLFPNKAYAGNRVGFAIALRNSGSVALTADTTTTLTFSDGSAAYEAPLLAPTALPPGGASAPFLFDDRAIPGALDPGSYTVTLHVNGTDGNGGNYSRDLQATLNPLALLPPYILLSALPIDSRVVRPGTDSIPLVRVKVANLYEDARTLTLLRVTNANVGPGTTAEKDSEWDVIRLVEDRNHDGVWGQGDLVLGSGTYSQGTRSFNLSLSIDPGDSTALLVLGDLSLGRARDGEGLDARIASVSDVVFGAGTEVAAAFPVNSPGIHFVDGFIAAQMTAYATFPSPLPAGANDSLALDVRVPSNGYRPDTLRTLTVQNAGTAAAGADIAEVRLWRDGGNGTYDRGGGDDAGLGVLYWTGAAWTRSGINLPVPTGGARLFATVDASDSPTDQRTLRLRVPVDGVSMASANDGPVDAAVLSPASRIIGGAKKIVIDLAASGEGTVRPGETSRLLAELSISNFYTDSVHIEGLAMENRSTGIAPDSVARLVLLYAGAFLTGPGGSPLPDPIATAAAQNGRFDLSGYSISVPPGGTRSLTVGAEAALRCVSDGDTMRVALAAPGDVDFRQARSASGAFPFVPMNPPVVDGHVAAQVAVHPLAGGALAPTETGRLALALTVPSNGCLPDTLQGVRVQNAGTAGPADIEALTLRAGETDLGTLVWNGQMWVREGIALSVPPGGASIEVRVKPAQDAEDGRTVRLAVPVGGLTLASSNDGPLDAALPSPATFAISTAPLFASLTVPSAPVSVGQPFDVEMTIENIDQGDGDTLVGVKPDSIRALGAALTLLESPPPDSAVRIEPGESARFVWRWRGDGRGTVQFAGSASGRRVSSGLSVSSPQAESNALSVQGVPSGVNLSPAATLPGVVSRGDRLVPLFVLSTAHNDPAGSGAAAVRIDTIRVGFENGDGSHLPPNRVLRGAVARRGGIAVGIVDSAQAGGSLLVIPIAPPLLLSPGGAAAVEILVDILEEPLVSAFRGVLGGASALSPRDANSLEPVPVTGSFPFRTPAASVVVPPSSLTVTVTGGLPPRVGRGAQFVPILDFTLESEGITGLTADLLIGELQIYLTDGFFPFDWARVSGPGITHFTGDQWSEEGNVLSFPLNPPVEVPVNNPIAIRLSGHLTPEAPLGLFRLGLDDTLFVVPRTQTDDQEVEVVLLLTEPIQSVVVAAADSLLAEGESPADTSVAYPGERKRAIFDLRFVHPGADSLSPISIAGVRFRAEAAAGDSVEMRSLIAQARVFRDGSTISSLAPLAEGSATLVVPFTSALALEPGDSAAVRFEADLRADAAPGDYRFAVAADGVDAADGIAGSPVAVRFLGADGSVFRTEPLRVRRISDRVDAFADLRLPPTTVGGAAVEEAARLRFAPSGGSEAAAVRLSGLRILVEDSGGDPIDPSEALAGATLASDRGGETVQAALDAEGLLFSFEPPFVISPGETLGLAVDLVIAETPAVSSFRIRLPLEDVVIADGNPAVRRAEGHPGTNPSATTHLAEKTFAASLRNYPNPFAPGREETTIAFYSRARGRAVIRVYTGLGLAVRSWEQRIESPGLVETRWDGRNGDGREVLSGVYLASVEVLYDDGKRDHEIHKIAAVR